MTRDEMTDEEYRKMIKKENFNYHMRIALAIITMAILVITEFAFGIYLYKHGFSVGRIFAVCIGWFFAYIILVVSLFLTISVTKSTIYDVKKHDSKFSRSDLSLIIYLIGQTILLGGGSQFLFWYFAFK